VDSYEKIGQVGEGTYGKVYKAKCLLTGDLVALKRIKIETEKEVNYSLNVYVICTQLSTI
jgi:serine/threonine protein kinase